MGGRRRNVIWRDLEDCCKNMLNVEIKTILVRLQVGANLAISLQLIRGKKEICRLLLQIVTALTLNMLPNEMIIQKSESVRKVPLLFSKIQNKELRDPFASFKANTMQPLFTLKSNPLIFLKKIKSE